MRKQQNISTSQKYKRLPFVLEIACPDTATILKYYLSYLCYIELLSGTNSLKN